MGLWRLKHDGRYDEGLDYSVEAVVNLSLRRVTQHWFCLIFNMPMNHLSLRIVSDGFHKVIQCSGACRDLNP